jgi:hypothetical protein
MQPKQLSLASPEKWLWSAKVRLAGGYIRHGIGETADYLAETGFGGTVTVWTAFTEASLKTGCLRFQPGTHRKMFYDEMK